MVYGLARPQPAYRPCGCGGCHHRAPLFPSAIPRLGAGTSAAFLFVIRGPGDIVHKVGKHKDQKLTFSLDLHFLLTFALKYKVAFSIEYEELH
jgi:hypothetical protein